MAECAELACMVQPLVSESSTRPTRSYIDLKVSNLFDLEYITFRNHYASTISIKQKVQQIDGDDSSMVWRSVLHRHSLMNDPHFENDAQIYHTISVRDHFSKAFNMFQTPHFRIYVSNPSPMWRSCTLREVKCHKILNHSPSSKTTVENSKPKQLLEEVALALS